MSVCMKKFLKIVNFVLLWGDSKNLLKNCSLAYKDSFAFLVFRTLINFVEFRGNMFYCRCVTAILLLLFSVTVIITLLLLSDRFASEWSSDVSATKLALQLSGDVHPVPFGVDSCWRSQPNTFNRQWIFKMEMKCSRWVLDFTNYWSLTNRYDDNQTSLVSIKNNHRNVSRTYSLTLLWRFFYEAKTSGRYAVDMQNIIYTYMNFIFIESIYFFKIYLIYSWTYSYSSSDHWVESRSSLSFSPFEIRYLN